MTMYKVEVTTNTDGGIHISVDPKPRPTEALPPTKIDAISSAFEQVVVKAGQVQNTARNRRKLKKEISLLLQDFTIKGLIEPSLDEENL